jgi:Domain of unknown function (DUF4279)
MPVHANHPGNAWVSALKCISIFNMEKLPPSEQCAESNEKYFFAYSATLRVFGAIPDLDAISTALGLQPTHLHRKGDRRSVGVPYDTDMWSYAAPVEKSEPLHKHIDALWAKLKPHKHYLLELKKHATVDVFLGYSSDCETAGVEIPYTSLELFIELEIPFGLSIVVT